MLCQVYLPCSPLVWGIHSLLAETVHQPQLFTSGISRGAGSPRLTVLAKGCPQLGVVTLFQMRHSRRALN